MGGMRSAGDWPRRQCQYGTSRGHRMSVRLIRGVTFTLVHVGALLHFVVRDDGGRERVTEMELAGRRRAIDARGWNAGCSGILPLRHAQGWSGRW